MKSERNETLHRLYTAMGDQDYALCLFGNELAKREGYKDIDGMEAVHLYLINKHHWLPRDVRSMTGDDIRLALHQEMQDWTLPPDAR